MKFIKSHVRLFEILFCVFSLFLAFMIALYVAGENNRKTINSAFGLSGSRIEEIESEDGEVEEVEDYYPATYGSDGSDESIAALKTAYEALCQEAEEEGIVLLSNDGALPLSKGSKVSLFGQGSKNLNYETTGSSSSGNSSSYATLKDALEYESRFSVNKDLWDLMDTVYAKQEYGRSHGSDSGYTINEAPWSEFTSVQSSFSTYNDAAIVTFSRGSGEGSDITAGMPQGGSTEEGAYGEDGSYLSLSTQEVELLKELTKLKGQTFKSIIVLLNTSSMIQLDFLETEGIEVDACLWVGNTGSHGAYAIGEVLCGEVNPSGRSVDTYLYDNFSAPATASWGLNSYGSATQRYANYNDGSLPSSLGTTNRNYAVYVEGIYVGYRYFETRYEDYVMGTGSAGTYDYSKDVAFPFGHGESYTTFSYSDFGISENSDEDGNVESYTVSVTVTNTGEVAGKEVVEVYLQKPYTDYDKENNVETASVELAGYAKTSELEPEGSEKVTITVQKEQFRSYDTEGCETYILDAGDYYLTVAKDSHDAVNNILAAKGYTVSGGKMDADGDKDLVGVALSQAALDSEIFATSSETGVEITNELDFADVNRYSNSGTNSVTYVSRSNWTGTFPSTPETLYVNDAMYQDLQSDWKEHDQSGYSKPRYGDDNGMTLVMLRGMDYDDDEGLWEELLDQMTYDEQSELVTLGYHGTVGVESISKPETVDENGPTYVSGTVTGGYCLPSEGVWAASYNDELIERIGNLMGDDCITSGRQGLYAPGVNIHRAAFCGRSHEYFSEDPYLSGMASVDEIKGIQSRGVIAYVKHFAFNDIETNRNGVSIWLNEQSAREIYLLPFEYSMRPSMGASHGVMTSFNRAGCIWTSASPELLETIGRDEWGFDGFYITDMADSNGAAYMTYYDGVMNGTNLYDGYGGSLSSYSGNYKFCNMLRESCHRILYNVCNYSAAMNGFTANTRVYTVMNWWQVLIIVLLVVAIVCTAAALVFYVLAEVFLRLGKGNGGGGGVRPKDAEDDDGSDSLPSESDRE